MQNPTRQEGDDRKGRGKKEGEMKARKDVSNGRSEREGG